MEEERVHEPVLLNEVLEFLSLQTGQIAVDATCGYLGHGAAIQRAIDDERSLYIGIDWDPRALEYVRSLRKEARTRTVYVQGNFSRIESIVRDMDIEFVHRILFDLGVSSPSLDIAEAGLGIKHPEASLDFRLSKEAISTAAEFLNSASEKQIADVLYQYGDERRSRAIARAVVKTRAKQPLETMSDFTRIVHRAYRSDRSGLVDSATRSAMALRIYLNREFENLVEGLEGAFNILAPGGRIAVISFHGGEDKIVKNFFRDKSGKCHCPPELPECICGAVSEGRVLTRKPVRPKPAEINQNPRSRSARLRVFEKHGKEQSGNNT